LFILVVLFNLQIRFEKEGWSIEKAHRTNEIMGRNAVTILCVRIQSRLEAVKPILKRMSAIRNTFWHVVVRGVYR
jgi:hypothetical protein